MQKGQISSMKKYSVIYAVSFIFYFLLYLTRPHISVINGWYEVIVEYLFTASVLYELIYLFYLRKREDVSFGKALARLFLYAFIAFDGIWIFHIVHSFFTGVSVGFFGDTNARYGFEAINSDLFRAIVLDPIFVVGIIYQIICFVRWKRKKK